MRSTLGILIPALLLAAHPAAGQTGENVFHPGDAIPWGAESNGVRTAPLYGDPSAVGDAFTFRIEASDGFEMAPHTHQVAEHMTVLSGRFFVGVGKTFDRAQATEYGPGSYVVIAAGVAAYMWTEGPTVVQVHGIGPLVTEFVHPPGSGPEQGHR